MSNGQKIILASGAILFFFVFVPLMASRALKLVKREERTDASN